MAKKVILKFSAKISIILQYGHFASEHLLIQPYEKVTEGVKYMLIFPTVYEIVSTSF
jgi:hypothetical protein